MRLLQLGLVVALTSELVAIVIYITGVTNLHESTDISDEDLEALQPLQSGFQNANGLGLQAASGKDYCQVTINFPSDIVPKWFGVIGNSGELSKTRFGKEIDAYDVVIRENVAPIQNYMEYVGRKSTFRLLNRGSAKALDKVVELDEMSQEVLIIKTTIHDIMNRMIRGVPIKNPVYLMLGASFQLQKELGSRLLNLHCLYVIQLICMVSLWSVDPGYKEWRVGAGSADPLASCTIKKKQVKRNPTVVATCKSQKSCC